MRGLTNSDSGGGGSDLVKRVVVNSIGNGTVTPSGIVAVLKGDSKTFTFSPDAGNRIQDIKLDGASLGAITEKTLTNIQTDHTLTAYFTPITYTITKNAGAHGTISGDTTVNWGSTPTYNIVPDAGCRIGNVTVDTTSMGAISSYTFPAVYANHTIAATFVQQFTVTASAGSNGTITPVGTTTYDAGATPTYTISPNTGYTIDTLKINGSTVTPTTSYTFPALSANMTIAVTFKINPFTKYTMTIPSGSGNSVSKNITFSDGAAGWNETQRDNLIKSHTKFAVVKWDGSKPVVNYWLYRANLNHKANDSTCNTDSGVASVLTGADGDVMVLYDRCWWSITKSGANWVISITWDDPASSGQSGTWVSPHHYGDSLSATTYATYVGMGVFEGIITSNQLRSTNSAAQPTTSTTQNNFYAAAISGRNWQYNQTLPMTYAWWIICLYFVKGDRNCQAAYGNGISSGSKSNVNAGWSATSPWINGDTSGQATGVTALGVHNGWGNIYKFMGEMRNDAGTVKFSALCGKDHYNIESGTASTWKSLSMYTTGSWACITEISGACPEYPFMATAGSGTDYSTYWADGAYGSSSSGRVILVGGSYNFDLLCGPLFVVADSAVDASHSYRGSRLHVTIL